MDAPTSLPSAGSPPKRLAVISCAALEKEIRDFCKDASHVVTIEILDMNLHERPLQLKEVLQKKIDELTQSHQPDAVALVFGLCGCGLVGVQARQCPVVVPRAHDCVTLYLGNKERYAQWVKEHPETYWFTPGWNESGRAPSPEKFEKAKQEYTEKFDEDEAEYLIDQEMASLKLYKQGNYIDLGVGDSEQHAATAQRSAEWLGWKFQRQVGNRQLLLDLLSGAWNEERFLIVPPSHEIQASADDRVMCAVPV